MTNTLQPFPWDEAIGFGLGVLKLSSAEFWRLTPRELALAAQAVSGNSAPLRRADFAQLMMRYPDGRDRQQRQ
ncbi:MAG: rcc01693 family protein [Pseudolabrys sp.]